MGSFQPSIPGVLSKCTFQPSIPSIQNSVKLPLCFEGEASELQQTYTQTGYPHQTFLGRREGGQIDATTLSGL